MLFWASREEGEADGGKKKKKTCNFIQILEETSTRLSTLYELPLLKLVHIFLV